MYSSSPLENFAIFVVVVLATMAVVVVVRLRWPAAVSDTARSRGSRARMAATWLGAAAIGIATGIGTVVASAQFAWDEWYVGGVLSYWAVLAAMPLIVLVARTPRRRLVASGLLFGFASFMRIGLGDGPSQCDSFFGCRSDPSLPWTIVTSAALVLAIGLIALEDLGARWAAAGGPTPPRHRGRGIRSGRMLIKDLERTLGIAVIVKSIDRRGPVTIEAVVMAGQFRDEVTAVGASESDAWRTLAEVATAWRNANDQQVPMWSGAGGF